MADAERLGIGGGVDPRESGKILRAARLKRGLTQGQLIDAVGIPNQSYLSALENGRYNIANSEYLPALARALDLSIEEIRAISPTAVIEVSSPKVSAAQDAEQPALPIPDSLKEAADLYGVRFPDLTSSIWQQYLAGFRPRGATADTPEEWLDLYRDLTKHHITPPGAN